MAAKTRPRRADALSSKRETMLRTLHAYGEMAREFERRKAELTTRYPNKWIGYYQGRIIVDNSLPKLIRAMKAAGIPTEHSIVEFLSTEEEVWILQAHTVASLMCV
ncbi:MAG: hypothetical protein HY681_02615 [Chloroflexi bacterium]|nr:hypothetical protein [Chloroflexota bacterium]